MMMTQESDNDDTAQSNIATSNEIISKLRVTIEKSKHVMRQVKSYHESQKMVENSKQLSIQSSDQIRRAKHRD